MKLRKAVYELEHPDEFGNLYAEIEETNHHDGKLVRSWKIEIERDETVILRDPDKPSTWYPPVPKHVVTIEYA